MSARQSRDRGMYGLLSRAAFFILFRLAFQMAKLDFGSSRRPGLEVILVRSELKDQVETSHEVLGAARVEKLASDLPHKPKQAVSGGQSYVAGQSGREQ